MPRAFTDREREHIDAQLHQAIRELVPQLGLARTTVTALARAAGVSKGAFYLFYESKEALVLAALLQDEAALRAEALSSLGRPEEAVEGAEVRIAAWLRATMRAPERFPLLRAMMAPEALERLMRALPPELLAANTADDDQFFADLLSPWLGAGYLHGVPELAALRLPRMVFALQSQRHLIGEDAYEALTELLVEALAARLARRGPDAATQGAP